MKKTKIFMILVLLIGITVLTYATRFGGFYGTDWGNTIPPVQAFLDTIDTYSGLIPAYDVEIQAAAPEIFIASHYTGGPYAAYVDNWDDYNNPYDVMDGVHMVMGFRTPAWIAPAVTVSTQYAHYICLGGEVLLKWFHAVWYYSYCQTTGYDKAAAVFSPYSQHDTLTSYSSDPAPYVLYCWWYE